LRFLIVGLGNIGEEYVNTRHNIGFLVLDYFSEILGFEFENARLAQIAKHRIKNKLFFFVKPNTYMNRSGRAVKYWMDTLKIPIDKTLIIVDDIALPSGKIRLRSKGGDGGHKGLADISLYLQTQNFPRLRFGISQDFAQGSQSDYVLGEWSPEEKKIIQNKLGITFEIIKSFANNGINKTMTEYNSEKKDEYEI
jgi:peptidyl-tRNA hydrolase, PTH1 family